jgi:rubredoxin
MEHEYWYRCSQCGYMYTPQQVLALVQLHAARSGAPEPDPSELPSRIPCRKRGCTGSVLRTSSIFQERR